MEAPEEALGSNSTSSNGIGGECTHGTSTAIVVKGKRTKRQRIQYSPALAAAMAVTDSSSASSADASGSITEEEEDMANCLILLAQGRSLDSGHKPESPAEEGGGTEKFTSRRFTKAATTTGGKAGFYVYECKTCNKCFPSFQALGGHRASHKKPKLAIMAAEEKKKMVEEDMLQISMNSFPKAIVGGGSSSSSKPRVHECSICGSEFNSGQALGGHMRRHRPAVIPEAPEAKKERTILSLDLNLPAPSDDDHPELQTQSSPAFSFASKPPLIFSPSASALVDCHY